MRSQLSIFEAEELEQRKDEVLGNVKYSERHEITNIAADNGSGINRIYRKPGKEKILVEIIARTRKAQDSTGKALKAYNSNIVIYNLIRAGLKK